MPNAKQTTLSRPTSTTCFTWTDVFVSPASKHGTYMRLGDGGVVECYVVEIDVRARDIPEFLKRASEDISKRESRALSLSVEWQQLVRLNFPTVRAAADALGCSERTARRKINGHSRLFSSDVIALGRHFQLYGMLFDEVFFGKFKRKRENGL